MSGPASSASGMATPGSRHLSPADNLFADGTDIVMGCSDKKGVQLIKILYHHRIASKDGQSVHIDSLISALRRMGHDVCVVSPPGFDKTDFGTQPGSLALLRRFLPKVAYEALEILYNIPVLWRLWRIGQAFRPDLIYERYNLYMMAGVLYARLRGLPIFLEVNSPLASERSRFGGLALAPIARWMERWTWRAADRVLPVSQVLADLVRSAGVAPERIAVIPNGIDDDIFQLRDRASAKAELGLQGKTVLGFVGFVRDWHGLENVIDLIADPSCPNDLALLVVGDGPVLPDLKARAQSLRISDRVTFTGLVGRDRLPQYIAAIDIALQPRSVKYASPLKIFEYMATEKAIVAPSQENITEILTDNKTALLFNPEDRSSLFERILRLFNDVNLRRDLGLNARQAIIQRRYTWSDNAKRITQLYSAVATGDLK